MTTVKSEKKVIDASAEKVFEKLSNLENLKGLLSGLPKDNIPEDKREMFDNLVITSDSIEIPAGPVGNITLRMADRLPYSLISLVGENTPVPLDMQLEIEPVTENSCEVQVVINIEVPAIIKPMISGPLKKITGQFVQVLGAIPFN